MFNALKYIEELEKSGFTREQAEVSMKLLIDIMNENFATKADIEKFATKADLKEVEYKLESRIHSLELKMESAFREMEYKLIIKLGTMMGAMLTLSIAITATLIKFIPSVGY